MVQNFDMLIAENAILSLIGVLLGIPIGQAFSPLIGWGGQGHISLNAAVDEALMKTDWRIFARLRRAFSTPRTIRQSSNDDQFVSIFLTVVISVTIVTFYVQHAVIVASVMAGMSILVAMTASVCCFILWRRYVVDGRQFAIRLVAVFVAVAVGVISAVWLLDPPRHADSLDALSTAIREGKSVLSVSEVHFGVIATQMFAAFLTFALLASSIALGLGSVTAVYIRAGVGWQWFWKTAFWCNRWAMYSRSWWALFIIGTLSLVMTSGYGFVGLSNALSWLSENLSSLLTTDSPTP